MRSLFFGYNGNLSTVSKSLFNSDVKNVNNNNNNNDNNNNNNNNNNSNKNSNNNGMILIQY